MCGSIWVRRAALYGVLAGLCNLAAAFAAAHTSAAELRLAILGDSLTAGYGLAAKDAFPARLEAALRSRGIAVTVLDAGVSGDTTADGLARLDWVLADRPTHAIVELGGNDALRGLDPGHMAANLSAILSGLKAAGVTVLLAGMRAPRNLGRIYVDRFDAVFPDLAARYGVLLYPYFLEGLVGQPTLMQPDGIHPNAAGVGRIVEGILDYVVPLLATTQRAPATATSLTHLWKALSSNPKEIYYLALR